MVDTATIPTRHQPPGVAVRWALCLLALIAAILSWILFMQSTSSGGLPGCGVGSGCDAVLSSQWATWLGVPVSLAAMVVYAGILAAALHIGPGAPQRRQRGAWIVLLCLATIAAAAAVWFIVVQAAILGQLCKYCTAVHVCGLLLAALIWLKAPIGRRRLLPDEPDDPVLLSAPAACALAALALLPVAGLILGQTFVPAESTRVERIAGGSTFDTGPGTDRQLTLLNGAVRVSPHEFPILGSPDAPVVIAELYDYTCPHCRRLHGHLGAARDRYGDQLAILALPVPLGAQCNRLVTQTHPRHETACELAKIAMAVWRADPAAFERMHGWLMAGENPPSPEAAMQHAIGLVGETALAAALDHPWVEQRILNNVELYAMTGGSLPQLMTTAAVIRGRPATARELFGLLEAETPLQSP